MKSYKTTLTGIIGAVAYALVSVLQSGTFTTKDIVITVVIAALGVIAKDYNATGKP